MKSLFIWSHNLHNKCERNSSQLVVNNSCGYISLSLYPDGKGSFDDDPCEKNIRKKVLRLVCCKLHSHRRRPHYGWGRPQQAWPRSRRPPPPPRGRAPACPAGSSAAAPARTVVRGHMAPGVVDKNHKLIQAASAGFEKCHTSKWAEECIRKLIKK